MAVGICAYDLDDGPVRITAETGPLLETIALHGRNGAYYAITDQAALRGTVELGSPGTTITRVFHWWPSTPMHHQRSACEASTRASIVHPSASVPQRGQRPVRGGLGDEGVVLAGAGVRAAYLEG